MSFGVLTGYGFGSTAGGSPGTVVGLAKGFMEDVLTVAGVNTLIPRYTFYDDFLGYKKWWQPPQKQVQL